MVGGLVLSIVLRGGGECGGDRAGTTLAVAWYYCLPNKRRKEERKRRSLPLESPSREDSYSVASRMVPPHSYRHVRCKGEGPIAPKRASSSSSLAHEGHARQLRDGIRKPSVATEWNLSWSTSAPKFLERE